MRKLRDNKSLGNAELQLIIQSFDIGSARRLPLSAFYFLSETNGEESDPKMEY